MSTIQDKFNITRQELSAALIERESEVDLVMTAMLAGEHCLFVGPPGTAKSMLADAMTQFIDGNRFSLLMNKYTEPREVVGPVDVMALKQGQNRVITDGMLPEADIAFLDEVFKASSAILNTMLRMLNERKFKNGLQEMDCPLQLAIAASNEWPTEAKELGALFDRFMFRKHVEPISTEGNIERLMFSPSLTPSLSTSLTIAELEQARYEASLLPWTDEAKHCLHEIRRRVTREGITIGDRRLRKSTTAVQSFAYLNGLSAVTRDDLEIVSHIWWVDPSEQPQIVADVVSDVARPSRMVAASLLADANQVFAESNPRNLESAAMGCKKLEDIYHKLKKAGTERSEQAAAKVAEKIKELRLGSLSSF